ncbi:Uncharacterised protein [Serratia rubidaea]|uniref:Uncharacterized protein n=1 Tax=Serratia rubidaea TaxID=61652 RepID=A0A4V6JHL6_SERRU|nr:Uncharacterised protein [Serratia rubidaea]
MTQHFRRLTLDDKHDYLALMLAAYAPIKNTPGFSLMLPPPIWHA